jgi:hypothetical protein
MLESELFESAGKTLAIFLRYITLQNRRRDAGATKSWQPR